VTICGALRVRREAGIIRTTKEMKESKKDAKSKK
jgi:hypothetical protein